MSHYGERLTADVLRIRERLRQMGAGVQEALQGAARSAGWEAADQIDPAYLSFAEQEGLAFGRARPREFSPSSIDLQDFDIVVDLTGKAKKYIPKVPFHTPLISWPLQHRGDPRGSHEQLAPRLNRLMGRLLGDGED